jgi:cobalt-precorrin 5A hydrolase
MGSIRAAVSADIKREEAGLIQAFDEMDIPLLFLSSRIIRERGPFNSVSEAACRQVALPGVSEPCALLGGRNTKLIMTRQVYDGVTIALAEEDACDEG